VSNESNSSEGQPGMLARWWRAPRRRWAVLGGVAVIVVGVILGVTLSSAGNSPAKSSTMGSAASMRAGLKAAPQPGSIAPAGTFTTVAGQQESISSLRGAPTMVWLVTTWCPVCQAGTRAMTSGLAAKLATLHVRVVELELYGDLGHPNQTMPAFVDKYAGPGNHGSNWMFGTASSALTHAYNPKGLMDVYFLVDSTGHIRYVNMGPATTQSQILAHAAALN
jgi:thiol-disulfide isomerase/thioredoxin